MSESTISLWYVIEQEGREKHVPKKHNEIYYTVSHYTDDTSQARKLLE